MLATEAEAKTKRCPESFGSCVGISDAGHMVAASSPYGHGYGISGSYAIQTAPALCIGSACMAWRWEGWVDPQRPGHVYERQDNRATSHVGYCGKAGRP